MSTVTNAAKTHLKTASWLSWEMWCAGSKSACSEAVFEFLFPCSNVPGVWADLPEIHVPKELREILVLVVWFDHLSPSLFQMEIHALLLTVCLVAVCLAPCMLRAQWVSDHSMSLLTQNISVVCGTDLAAAFDFILVTCYNFSLLLMRHFRAHLQNCSSSVFYSCFWELKISFYPKNRRYLK